MERDDIPSPPAERNRLGERLRRIRREKGLTLADLAARSGISTAALSKAERGLSAIGYDRFGQLAGALGVDVAELFADGRRFEAGLVATAAAGEVVRHVTENYDMEMLFTGVSGKTMTPIMGTLPAGRTMDLRRFVRHPGQEFIHVVSGAVRILFEDRPPVDLRAGESAYFDSGMGHLYTALGPVDARVLVVCAGLGASGVAALSAGSGPDAASGS
jgi:transcriptional regulator with XRE-family HTH domain